MRPTLTISLLLIISTLVQAQDLEEMAQQIKESQMMDETIDWKYYGNFPDKLRGVDNELTVYLETLEPNTTVRMYLVAKTDCIVYFDVTDKDNAYVFGTRDAQSLESDLAAGFKAATSIYTFKDNFMMNVNFGLRWGCQTMIDTEMKLLVFYANKNAD